MAQTKVRSSTQLNIDANLDLASRKIVNLSEGTDPNDAVNKSQLDNAVAGLAMGLLAPVQDLTALKAVGVSASIDKYMINVEVSPGISMSPLKTRIDKYMINVEDVGLFRYDHQSTLTPDDQYVVKPNSVTLPNPGRWVKMSNYLHDHNSQSGLQGGNVTERYHLSLAAYTIANQPAMGSQSGYLTSADWTAFNNKFDSSKYICREVPSGTVNGSNADFTLTDTPISGTEMVFVNGILQNAGSDNDYTISGDTITFAQAPKAGDVILVTYWRQ